MGIPGPPHPKKATPWQPSPLEVALESLPEGVHGLAAQTWLRRRLEVDQAREAAALLALRSRAGGKFAEPGRCLLTAKGLEQASSLPVARARAGRIAQRSGGGTVLDGTAGLGADSIAIARAGLAVVALEADAETCLCLAANLARCAPGARVLRADVGQPPVGVDLLVLDPDRRPPGRGAKNHQGGQRGGREGDPEAWSPPRSVCLDLIGAARGACLKLPPACTTSEWDALLPTDLPRSWQWVSLDGELKETVLWTGCLVPKRGAELPEALVIDARAGRDPVESSLRRPRQEVPALDAEAAARVAWIAEPDPAIIRAGLVGALACTMNMRPLDPHIAYLGSTEASPGVDPVVQGAGLARGYRVLASSPLDRRRLGVLLRQHDIGPLTIKKRGHRDDADTLARRLRGPGRRRGLVIVARIGDRHRAFLAEPVA